MTIFSSDRFEEVVVHDLRTPLNVIQLALRMLDDSAISHDPDAVEDLSMIRANAQELDRMLTHLVDYSHLPQSPSELALEHFDPRVLLDEVVDEIRSRTGAAIQVETGAAPLEVYLDRSRARLAFQKALLNAVAAAVGSEIRVVLEERGDRCVTTIVVNIPPRDSVYSHQLDPVHFVRLVGTAAERRGLDATISSRVSRLFGGVATLESNRGQDTRLVLDWPLAMTPGDR